METSSLPLAIMCLCTLESRVVAQVNPGVELLLTAIARRVVLTWEAVSDKTLSARFRFKLRIITTLHTTLKQRHSI